MAQTFKLRLGDGTTMAVDHQGLRTWTADHEATVQTKAGWRPLREVLAVLDRPPQPGEGEQVIRLKPLSDGSAKPPPSTQELSTLRFASSDDDADEVYEEDVYEGPTVLSTAWLWLRRLVLLGALAGGAVVLANTWQTWLPQAGRFGIAVLAQIDNLRGVRPANGAHLEPDTAANAASHQAAQAAAEQLPHLSAETIELVMASSLEGVLEAPEVFRRAHEAADRGTGILSSAEAQELKELRAAVLGALRPAERQQMNEYESARTVRPTLAFEDKAALGSFAFGARSLPAARRERLRALLGKAVAAGLKSPRQTA
jgi:hypothetical protein